MNTRRTFVGSLIAAAVGLFTRWLPATVVTKAATPQPQDGWRPDPDKDLVWCVLGGSFATLHMGPPVRVFNPQTEHNYAGIPSLPPILTLRPVFGPTQTAKPPQYPQDQVWFEMPRGGHPEGMWPRSSYFAVSHQIMVGTVEQIAEDFKQRLITAAKLSMFVDEKCDKVTPMWAGKRGEEHYAAVQQHLRELVALHAAETLPHGSLALPTTFNEPEMARYDQRLAALGGPGTEF